MHVEDSIGSRVTNNLQLTKLGKEIFGSDYLGTFSSDQFPKYIRENTCFILNTDSKKSKNKYGHWVSFIKINKKLYYFDSFMRSPSELSKYWTNRKLFSINKIDRTESYNESNCGERALSMLILMKRYGEKAINVV